MHGRSTLINSTLSRPFLLPFRNARPLASKSWLVGYLLVTRMFGCPLQPCSAPEQAEFSRNGGVSVRAKRGGGGGQLNLNLLRHPTLPTYPPTRPYPPTHALFEKAPKRS